MLAVKSMDVRDNFKSLCDKVFNGETLIISRPKNENIVMLSEHEYNEMVKAKRNADYLAMLDKSMGPPLPVSWCVLLCEYPRREPCLYNQEFYEDYLQKLFLPLRLLLR